MHLKRWITGLSALPFLIYLVYLGGAPFILLVGIACVCSLWEYFRIITNADRPMMYNAVTFWGYLVSIAILISAQIAGPASVLGLIALNFVLAGVFSVFIYKTNPAVVQIIQKQILGIVYIPLSLSFLVVIRHEPEGMIWIFLLLAIIFAGDISAFYVGTYLGRHKLSPAISPGKTIEGAIGGLAANLVAGAIGKFFFFPAILILNDQVAIPIHNNDIAPVVFNDAQSLVHGDSAPLGAQGGLLHHAAGRSTDMECSHGELGSGFADGLRGDNADRLSHFHPVQGRHIATVTFDADSVF